MYPIIVPFATHCSLKPEPKSNVKAALTLLPNLIKICNHTRDLNITEGRFYPGTNSMSQQMKNEFIARSALEDTRSLFRNSNFKAGNKIRPALSFKYNFEKVLKIKEIRNMAVRAEHKIYLSAKAGAGNCGEMATLAYCLCVERGLAAEYIDYEDSIIASFNHASCMVSINGNDYIIDPWANLFCKKSEHIDKLVKKSQKWAADGKYITVDSCWTYNANAPDRCSATFKIVREEDIRRLTVAYQGKLLNDSGHDFDTKYVANRIQNELLPKETA